MGNIAGVPHNRMIADVTEEELDRMLAINLKGPFFGVQAALGQMLTQRLVAQSSMWPHRAWTLLRRPWRSTQ